MKEKEGKKAIKIFRAFFEEKKPQRINCHLI
jgi:hypothetical protein